MVHKTRDSLTGSQVLLAGQISLRDATAITTKSALSNLVTQKAGLLLTLLLTQVRHSRCNNAIQVGGHILVDLLPTKLARIDSLSTGSSKASRHALIRLRPGICTSNTCRRRLIVRLRGIKRAPVLIEGVAPKTLSGLRGLLHRLICALSTGNTGLLTAQKGLGGLIKVRQRVLLRPHKLGSSALKIRLRDILRCIYIGNASLLRVRQRCNKRTRISSVLLETLRSYVFSAGVDGIVPRQNLWRNLNLLCCL